MDIKNLSTFIHVAELRSFTKAGEKLGYSQSTISFQIRQLENELGVPLFERINRTVSLTDHGSRLLRCAYQINELLDSFLQEAERATDIRGNVRLVMADSLCNEVIGRIFPQLHKQYPDITLECISAGTQEMFRMLNQNEADLVYTLDRHIHDMNYVNLQERQIGVHFVCGANHPLAEQTISLKELVRQPFLLTEQGMSYRKVMDDMLAEQSMEIKPVFVSGNTQLLCNLTEQGAGISFLPDYLTKEWVDAGKLKYLYVPKLKVEIWTQLLHHRDKWLTEPMRVVIDYLQKCEL